MKRNFTDCVFSPVVRILVLGFVATFAIPSFAAPALHAHSEIIDAASSFALNAHSGAVKIDVSVNKLDARLQLSQCSQELVLFWPPGATKFGRTSIGVECPDRSGWKIYARSLVDVYDYIAVLSEPVEVGDRVSEQNVRMELTNLSGMRGDRLTSLDSVMDHRYKRRFSQGRALTHSMVAPPRLVEKGSRVLISYGSPSIKVQMKGVALSHGEKGAVIKVKNASSNKIVHGEVVSRNLVKVVR
ncbi:MAG: flagellar basal body P-ring formation chaperone FlgA [Pseudomonadales bacterium]